MKPIYALPIIIISLSSAIVIGMRTRLVKPRSAAHGRMGAESLGRHYLRFCHKNLNPDNKQDGFWGEYLSCGGNALKSGWRLAMAKRKYQLEQEIIHGTDKEANAPFVDAKMYS